jgi:hypothetical protein
MYNFSCDSKLCKDCCQDNKVVVIVETNMSRILALPGIYDDYGTIIVDFNSTKEFIRLDEYKPFWNVWKQIKSTDILGLRGYCRSCYDGMITNPHVIPPQSLKTIRDFYPKF